MLVDRSDAIFAPDRLIKRLHDRKVARRLRRSRVRSGVVPCVLKDKQTTVRMSCMLEGGLNPVSVVRDIIVLPGNEQRSYLDGCKTLNVPCLIRWLFTPGRDGDDSLDATSIVEFKPWAIGCPIL